MKRTILIPILLSTFLLVGCESDLDICIEANVETVTDLNDEEYFKENERYCSSYESYKKKIIEIQAQEAERHSSGSWRLQRGESEKERHQRNKEMDDKYAEDLTKAMTEFKNSCHLELRKILYSKEEKRIRESEAERFCNSQGIY